jgi:hypothetical protein
VLQPQERRDTQLWGNFAHIAPELLSALRAALGSVRLDFSGQPAFELGVLMFELCTGGLHVLNYPVVLEYTQEDLVEFPEEYEALAGLARSLVRRCFPCPLRVMQFSVHVAQPCARSIDSLWRHGGAVPSCL